MTGDKRRREDEEMEGRREEGAEGRR